MSNKKFIRKKKLLERTSISAQEIENAELKITSQFVNATSSLNLKKVGIYFSVQNEVPTFGIANYLRSSGIKCYLPSIEKNLKVKKMRFVEYSIDTKLEKNQFNIYEPKNHFFLNPLLLDLAILPLVAFDEYGFRLGMGKGYYDLTFQKKKNQKKPILWGLCYDFQETKTCYPESHDLKMDAILSPSGIRNF